MALKDKLMKEIKELDDAVAGYKSLLDAEFESRWKARTVLKMIQGCSVGF